MQNFTYLSYLTFSVKAFLKSFYVCGNLLFHIGNMTVSTHV